MPLTCKKCKTKFDSDAELDIYGSVAKKINMILGEDNGITISAPREECKIDTNEVIQPNTYWDDIYHAVLEIHKNFTDMGNWDVTEIIQTEDEDYRKKCNVCGRCEHCVKCSGCGKHYVPLSSKYVCPNCNSRRYEPSYIPEFQKKDGKLVCPYCTSSSVIHTQTIMDKQCPRCKSKDISKPVKVKVYQFTISKPPRSRK